ncbi:hypothetical protein FSP39_005714 [Pinctada imbricata]|uniref:Integrase catalytic domain-containing protein n=1 Tax=Pinctada imbricata TaxID=66713 RepID=A0AA88YAH7_PINIB|nr:hypothetical protein FSP39_005714 [Pinctada imbricata]
MPDRPWQRIGTDLCEHDGKQYLIVMDYFSRYIEIVHLNSITSANVIGKLKNMFARWGIPTEVVSDNGGQFASTSFREFASQYGFKHVTSSPHYPQANGQAESGVKIAKRILKQPDIFLALMAYRSTPVHATGSSPAELIMGRKMRTIIPVHPDNLEPEWPNLDLARKKDAHAKLNMRTNFNLSHGARNLTSLSVGDKVRLKTDKEKHWNDKGVVVSADYRNRSYEIQTNHGIFRRNRRHILHTGDEPWESLPTQEHVIIPPVSEPPEKCLNRNIAPDSTTPNVKHNRSIDVPTNNNSSQDTRDIPSQGYKTRSGRLVTKPKYLQDYVS